MISEQKSNKNKNKDSLIIYYYILGNYVYNNLPTNKKIKPKDQTKSYIFLGWWLSYIYDLDLFYK